MAISKCECSLTFASTVSVGFEYESCPDMILWEKRTAILQGYESTASNLGGWSIDKHHALNIQSGEPTYTLPHTLSLLFVPTTLELRKG